MKKILSLLALLVMTLTAFATEYTGHRTVTFGVNPPTESDNAVLTITDNGNNTFNVTFKDVINVSPDGYTDNYGTYTFSNVAGTTENGVTTIDLSNLSASVENNYAGYTAASDGVLFAKFNAEKAYATFSAKIGYRKSDISAVFGVDDFESTGGGETGGGEPGGEDKPAIVDVVDADYAPNGTKFAFPFTINWGTQKLVAKLDLSTCKRNNNNEGIITVGTDNGNGDVSLWNPNYGEANCHLYYTRYYYDYKTSTTNEKLLNLHYLEKPSDEVVRVDESIPNFEPGLVVFTFDKDGLHVGDNLIASAADMTTLYNSTSLIFGSKEGATRSYATYKYVKVVPADWTETTEPEVTEVSSKSFEDKLYAFADGENIEQGNATVKISNMSDETIKMSLVFGDTSIESANIEQGTDDKGRTTYTGTADWEGVNFAVSAVVYTKDEAEKIYMTLTSNDAKYTVGTDPDYVAPEPPSIEGTVVEGSVDFAANGSKFEWSNIAIDWNKQKLVAVIDLSSCTGESENILSVGQNIDSWSIGGWHFYYTVALKKMKSDYLATDGAHPVSDPKTGVEPGTVHIELSKAEGCTIDGVSYNALYDSKVTGTWQSNTEDFWKLTSVNIGSKEGGNRSHAVIKYVTVVDLPVTVEDEKTFNEVLYKNDQKFADATVVVKEMSDETINMSLKYGENEYTSTELTKGTDEKNRTTYTGKVSKDSQTYDVAGVVYEKDNAERLYMTMTATGETYVIGENPDYVAPVTYKNTLKVVRGTDTKSYENAEVSVLAKGENKYAVTIPSFSDMDQDEGTIGKLTFEATGVEENGTLKLTATSAATTQEGGDGWENYDFTASMDATVTGETLAGTFTVVYPDEATNYTYTLYYGVEPPVASEKPKDVTVVEKYQADGTGFSHTINVDWDKQKIVASIDFSNGGDDKDILAMTTGDSFTAFQTSTYRTMHWFCNQTAKQMSGFFAKDGAGNNNTGRFDVADCLAKFEISKAEGLKVNGEVKMTPDVLEDLLTGDPIIIGSGESPKFSKAYYNYIKVVSLDWTEPTEPEERSNKTYTSNLRILDGETTVVEEAEANVNIVKYSDESYKVTLKNVNMLNKTQDLVFVGTTPEEAPTAEAAEPLTINAKSDEATTTFFGKQVNGTFEITEVSDDVIKMEFAIEGEGVLYEGEFNYTEEEEPEVYTSNLHIYDTAAPETDLFQADQAKVEFLATETGEFTLTLKDVTLNENTQDLVFTGTLPTTEPGGQEPLAEEGEGEVTPAEPAKVLNATADEATATFLGATSATAEFTISYNAAEEFMMTFTMKAGEKNYGGEFNYEAKTPATEPFCKENYVADGNGFEWEIPVDWDTQKIVMSIDPSTCTGNCEDVIGLGAVPTDWDNTLHLYRTRDQKLQGYFNVPGGNNNNTDKFAETVPFLVEVSKAQGFVVNDEVKIAASEMSYLFTLPTVKMGTGEANNDKSRATYNYVKVVDKDWTKDPETGINATTVAEGEFEVFSVDGVKLSKLQKGLNIVRSADGKVKKVLVK